jgi:NAD(P) transhydrogenase subunit alpha
MIVGVPKETFPGERRVALVPASAQALSKAEHELLIEAGAGEASGFRDSAYREKGFKIAANRDEVFQSADAILQVRALGENPEAGRADLPRLRAGQALIAFMDPLGRPEFVKEAAPSGAGLYSMELIPRITRAQSMDALSSMATIAGYKAVLLAADRLTKIFPMMMTAAGTIAPARVFIIGAGVAGLQAIATARRLGAVVTAYDVRAAAAEQVESLGATFLKIELETGDAETKGGYAKEQSEEQMRRQREMMTEKIAESDVVITTAAVPGKKAPILVSADQVKAMAPGSVIVDLAAERGGNCALTKPGETIEIGGVSVIGATNLPSAMPHHASQMYAKNIATLLLHLARKEGKIDPEDDDEIARETRLTSGGKVVHPKLTAAPAGAS